METKIRRRTHQLRPEPLCSRLLKWQTVLGLQITNRHKQQQEKRLAQNWATSLRIGAWDRWRRSAADDHALMMMRQISPARATRLCVHSFMTLHDACAWPRDRVLQRGIKAKKEAQAEPKEYPLNKGEWSSCDESDDESDWDTARATMGF